MLGFDNDFDAPRPSYRHLVQGATKWLSMADNVLSAIYKAREGGTFSAGLAVAAAAKAVIDVVLPQESPHQQLLGMGYKRVSVGLGAFFCERLWRSTAIPKRVMPAGTNHRLVFWGDGDAVAAIYDEDDYRNGPFTKGGQDEPLVKVFGQVAWESGTDLMLGVSGPTSRSRSVYSPDSGEGVDASSKFELLPLPEPGAWIGEPKLEWFVERLKRHEGETRSMLLTGPSGVGKSVLARLIAKSVEGGRTLKVASNALRRCAPSDLINLVRFMKPSVLLLDDLGTLQRHEGDPDEQMLELFEALRGKAKLVLATLMKEPDGRGRKVRRRGSVREDGTNYYAAMRPGRIDEVVRVNRPSPKIREDILLHYLGGQEGAIEKGVTKKLLTELVERCQGLTGAYLAEVAHRIAIHGVKTWKSEVASVRAAAPLAERERVHFQAVFAMKSADIKTRREERKKAKLEEIKELARTLKEELQGEYAAPIDLGKPDGKGKKTP